MSDPQQPNPPGENKPETPSVNIDQKAENSQGPVMVGYAETVHVGDTSDRKRETPPYGNSNFLFAVIALVALVVVVVVIALVIISQNGGGGTALLPPPTATATVTTTATPSPTATPTIAVAANSTETPAATDTATATDTLTAAPSATDTSTLAATATPTATLTNTATPTHTPTTPAPALSLNIRRSRDTLALCLAGGAANLAGLSLDFEHNERYTLGNIFPASAASVAGDCWCVRQNPVLAAPPECRADRTAELGDVGGDWINATVLVELGGYSVQCPAQAQNVSVYGCPALALAQP